MALNLNGLIYTSADYRITLTANGIPVPLNTVESFDYGRDVESEYIHSIGTEEPIGLKTNTATYPGKLSLQAGELELFLAAQGLVFASQITDAVIAIIGGTTLVKVFKGVVIKSHKGSVKVKDKQSLITLDFESIGVAGI